MSKASDRYNGVWNYPTKILFGAGKVRNLTKVCRDLKMVNPLLVTDRELIKLSFVTEIKKTLQTEFQLLSMFSGIKSNPTGDNIADGVKAFVEGNHDGVIALGGGSALDAGGRAGIAEYLRVR